MSDANGREPFAKSRDSDLKVRELDANGREEWLSVVDAAQRLGVSVRTVQKRAAKGELPSKMEEGRRLLVCLPLRDDCEESREEFANVRESGPEVREPDATPSNDALIEQLQSENAFLRERIENHEQEIQRRDVAEAENRRLWLSDRQELSELKQQLAITTRLTPDATQETPGNLDGKEPGEADKTAGDATQGQARRKWYEFWKGSR